MILLDACVVAAQVAVQLLCEVLGPTLGGLVMGAVIAGLAFMKARKVEKTTSTAMQQVHATVQEVKNELAKVVSSLPPPAPAPERPPTISIIPVLDPGDPEDDDTTRGKLPK